MSTAASFTFHGADWDKYLLKLKNEIEREEWAEDINAVVMDKTIFDL